MPPPYPPGQVALVSTDALNRLAADRAEAATALRAAAAEIRHLRATLARLSAAPAPALDYRIRPVWEH